MKKLMLVLTLLAFAGMASADTVNFACDSAGAKANGFVSCGSPNVSFYDSNGSGLEVGNFGGQSDGQGLANRGDDPGYLLMNFTGVYTYLTLDFGNDDPFWAAPGSQAALYLYLGGNLVGSIFMENNLDDLMNQTISTFGIAFDQAVFMQIGPWVAGQDGLIEVVDNIEFGQVPEPASMVLFGSGLIALGTRLRKRLSA